MSKLLERLNALILLFMFVITTMTVIFRYFLGISVGWSEELAQYSYIFLSFIGASVAMKDESHISITILLDRTRGVARRVMLQISRLLTAVFMLAFTAGAFQNMKFNWTVALPTVEWMKIGYMYLVLVISGVVSIIYTSVNFVKGFSPNPAGEAKSGGAA